METPTNREHFLWRKIKAIILETLIIVFAVSISIWLNNLNTDNENEHKEKEFFEGLANDLKKDVAEWKKEKAFYIEALAVLDHQICIGENNRKCDDSLHFNSKKDNRNITQYTPIHNSYFEAAKSSGLFSTVKQKELLLETVNYYQEAVPFIKAQKEIYNYERTRLLDVYKENAEFVNDRYNFDKMLKKPAVLFQAKRMRMSIYIIDHYDEIITKTQQLITKIEKIN